MIVKEDNLECLDIFKTQPGPVVKNETLGHPAWNYAYNLTNVVWGSANWAMGAVAEIWDSHWTCKVASLIPSQVVQSCIFCNRSQLGLKNIQ